MNLITVAIAAIALWNTVYLERAINALQESAILWGMHCCNSFHHQDDEHSNLVGDYLWRISAKVGSGKFT